MGRTLLRETIRQILREESALKVGDIRQALDAAKGDSDISTSTRAQMTLKRLP